MKKIIKYVKFYFSLILCDIKIFIILNAMRGKKIAKINGIFSVLPITKKKLFI